MKKDELCVPVTKSKPLAVISDIAKRFIKDQITIGVVLSDGGKYVIWREYLPGDEKCGITEDPPPEEKVYFRWNKGQLVKRARKHTLEKYFKV